MGIVKSISALILLFAFLAFATSPFAAEPPLEVVVEGVTGEVLDNVRQSLALPSGMVREGKTDKLWLERYARQAEQQVLTAVEPYGYYNARANVQVEPLDRDRFRLRVQVSPGEPVRLTEVKVSVEGPGENEDALQELRELFPLDKGNVLVQPEYEQAKGELKSRAQELGYLDADYSVHQITVNKNSATARIALVLNTGQQYHFGDVEIEGAPDYPEKFLRRFITFRSGEIFSYSKLGESQLNFTNSERFREVVVTPQKEDSRVTGVPVLVHLKELPRRTLRPGLGYGTDTGARFTVRFRDLNVFHLGHEYHANLYISERLQGFVTGYVLPDPRDIKSSTTLQLNLQQQDVTTYLSRIVALELARNRSMGKGVLGTAYLKLQQESFTIGAEDSTTRVVLPGVRLSVDRYRDLVRPVSGYRYSLDLRGTDYLLGSTTRLVQLLAEGSYLLPLPWRLSLHVRGKGGITLLSEPLTDLPPSLRFFAGGDQSVRGYSYQSLGPRNANGEVVGGKQLLVGSVELERALFQSWGVSAFYDAGNAFNNFSEVRLEQGAGIGVHYYTRVGALNFSVARQVGVEEPAFRFHFSVGLEL